MQMFSENVDNFRVSASPDFSVSSLPAAVACFSGGASQVGRRRGTFGSSAGLKMTTEQNNLILAWEKLCWTASTSTYTLHTVHWKHWNITHILYINIPENEHYTLHTSWKHPIHYTPHNIQWMPIRLLWSFIARSHLTLPWHSTRRILIY